jgi:hypothetical protein
MRSFFCINKMTIIILQSVRENMVSHADYYTRTFLVARGRRIKELRQERSSDPSVDTGRASSLGRVLSVGESPEAESCSSAQDRK